MGEGPRNEAPIPLVTLTLTTDEVAMVSAGLIELRRFWAKRYLNEFGAINPADPLRESEAAKMIRHITEFKQRLDDSVSDAQGNALLQELLTEKGNDPKV